MIHIPWYIKSRSCPLIVVRQTDKAVKILAAEASLFWHYFVIYSYVVLPQ